METTHPRTEARPPVRPDDVTAHDLILWEYGNDVVTSGSLYDRRKCFVRPLARGELHALAPSLEYVGEPGDVLGVTTYYAGGVYRLRGG